MCQQPRATRRAFLAPAEQAGVVHDNFDRRATSLRLDALRQVSTIADGYVPVVSPRLPATATTTAVLGRPVDRCSPGLASRGGGNFPNALGIGQ